MTAAGYAIAGVGGPVAVYGAVAAEAGILAMSPALVVTAGAVGIGIGVAVAVAAVAAGVSVMVLGRERVKEGVKDTVRRMTQATDERPWVAKDMKYPNAGFKAAVASYTFDKLVQQNSWTNHYSHDDMLYDFDDIKSSYDAKSICKQVPSTREAHSWKTGGHHSRPSFPPRLDRSWIPPKGPWKSCTPTSPCSSSPLRTPPTTVKSILALSTR